MISTFAREPRYAHRRHPRRAIRPRCETLEIRSLLTAGSLDFSQGFPGQGLTLNGSATYAGTTLQLTDGGSNEAGSAFTSTPVSISDFSTTFSFQVTNPQADGLTFTVQGNGPTALGGYGGMLGYGGMARSLAVKFDLFDNAGEGSDSTGYFTGGATPTATSTAPAEGTGSGSIDLTGSGIDFHSGDVIQVSIAYNQAPTDPNALEVQETDTRTGVVATQLYNQINLPRLVGGPGAWVGFTGGTGGLTATQQILSWTYSSNSGDAATYGFTASGNDETASLVGGASLGADQDGNAGAALALDGTGEADAADDPILDPTNQLTVAAWIDATDWNGNRRIIQKSDPGADDQYRLTAEYGQLKFDVAGVGSVTGPLPTAGAWHHVAGTYDGTTMRLYEDGLLVASAAATGSIATTAGPLVIGDKPGSSVPGDHFVGSVDSIEVDNFALTSNQVADLVGRAPSAPTYVAAHATSGTGAFVSWNGDGTADGYVIEVSTDGTNFTPVLTADDPGATSALVTGLSPSTTYTIAVVAANASGDSTASAAPPFTTPAGGGQGWYLVTAPDADPTTGLIPVHHDSAADTSVNAGLKIRGSGYVQAGSAEEAIFEVLTGSVTNQQTGRSYDVTDSGAYRYTSDYVTAAPGDAGPAGTHVGSALAFEDLWQVDPGMYDWNDDYILAAARPVAPPSGIDHTGWKVVIVGGGTQFNADGTVKMGADGNPALIQGRHAGATGATPSVVQGMQWSGNAVLEDAQGNVIAGYTLANLTWKFPSGAVKGYGQFTKMQERPGAADPGDYWVFSGPPKYVGNMNDANPGSVALSDHYGTDDYYGIYGYNDLQRSKLAFTPDDLNYNASEQGDHVINQFYWGPDAGAYGPETISVDATFTKVVNGQVDSFEGSDSDQYRVVRPKGNVVVTQLGQAGVSGTLSDGTQWLQLDKGNLRNTTVQPTPPLGIQYYSTVVNPAGFGGSFFNTQTMLSTQVRVSTLSGKLQSSQSGAYVDAAGNNVVDNAGKVVTSARAPVVDNPMYPGRVDDPNIGPGASQRVNFAPVDHKLYSNDSPGSSLPGLGGAQQWVRFTRDDNFDMIVMYNPNPNPGSGGTSGVPSSIPIPVGVMNWRWTGEAIPQGDTWVTGFASQATPPPGRYSPTTTFPTWTRKIQEVEKNVMSI